MDSTSIDLPTFKEVAITCPDHGQVKGKILCFNGNESAPVCKQCQTEKQEQERQAKERQREQEELHRKRQSLESRLGSAMIPLRFQQHSFETFLEETSDHARRKKSCQKYAENFSDPKNRGASMILCGTTGTGKTHLACSIANHIIRHQNKTALFMTVIDAVRRVKETYRKNSQETEREAIMWFLGSDLLILDEVGVQFGSDTEKMILFEIINKRYESMKPTILLSNLAPDPMKEFVGERIWDRMKEGGGRMLTFNWESYRKAKK